jgi:hypothetical protein
LRERSSKAALARDAQSSIWKPNREAIASLVQMLNSVDDRRYLAGYDERKISLNKARKQIVDAAGGIGEPS